MGTSKRGTDLCTTVVAAFDVQAMFFDPWLCQNTPQEFPEGTSNILS